jgi:hypothetical protein
MHIVSKVTIDALVTAAAQWGGETLSRATTAPDEEGSMLWQSNFDASNYGGPLEMLDPEMRAELQDEDIQKMPAYQYEPVPGKPSPAIVQAVLDNYLDPCDGDCYPGTASEKFTTALQVAITARSGGTKLRQLAEYEAVPRRLVEEHRSTLFMSVEGPHTRPLVPVAAIMRSVSREKELGRLLIAWGPGVSSGETYAEHCRRFPHEYLSIFHSYHANAINHDPGPFASMYFGAIVKDLVAGHPVVIDDPVFSDPKRRRLVEQAFRRTFPDLVVEQVQVGGGGP